MISSNHHVTFRNGCWIIHTGGLFTTALSKAVLRNLSNRIFYHLAMLVALFIFF